MIRTLFVGSDNAPGAVVTGSIAGTTLTVAAITQGALAPGELLIDGVWPTMNLAVGTVIVKQLTGTTWLVPSALTSPVIMSELVRLSR